MARKCFYSFHYEPDNWRASQVRNIGVIEGNEPAKDNDWESVSRGGDAAIEKWIDSQMSGRSCVIVLIGAGTAGRKWITHEISKGWNDGKGVVGIRIHKLKDRNGNTANTGSNPFDHVTFKSSGNKLSSVVKVYDPPGYDSRDVYAHISDNLSKWVEEAVAIRAAN